MKTKAEIEKTRNLKRDPKPRVARQMGYHWAFGASTARVACGILRKSSDGYRGTFRPMHKTEQIAETFIRRILMRKYVPGEVVPMSCNYKAYDENGHDGGKLYLEEGKRFPATQHSGSYYVMDMESEN